MRRSLVVMVMLLPAVFMSGCSDYPTSGEIDTRVIRERADVEEITGKVFGIKPGAEEAVTAYADDMTAARTIDDQYIDYVINESQGNAPELTLTYDGVPSDQLLSAAGELEEAAQAWYDEKKAEHDAEIAEIQAEIDKHEATKAKLKDSGAAYDKIVADAKANLEKATQELNEKIGAYQSLISDSIADMDRFASAAGSTITGFTPLKRVQYIDFSRRNANPTNCPNKNGRVIIDMRDTNNRCVYLTLPRNVAGSDVESKATKAIRESYMAMVELQNTIGEKGGWGSDKTGLYKKVDEAENVYEQKVTVAENKYGSARARNRKVQQADYYLKRAVNEMEEKTSETYVENYVFTGYFQEPEAFLDARQAYDDAMFADIMTNYLPAVSDITMAAEGQPNGVFKGLPSELQGIITATDVLGDIRGRKQVVRSIIRTDLTDEAVANADSISLSVERENSDLRGRDDSLEKMKEEVMNHYLDTLDG